jgi:hypothetical protein
MVGKARRGCFEKFMRRRASAVLNRPLTIPIKLRRDANSVFGSFG